MSIDKCGVLYVCKGVCSAPQQFKLHDSSLPIVSSYRDLGITITSDLAPSTHINNTNQPTVPAICTDCILCVLPNVIMANK